MNWQQADIQKYIDDKIQESLLLDYKAADSLDKNDAKRREITKDVSAMANSAGGIIIYGIREHSEADKKYLPEKIDPIDRSQISKEWLEHIINNIRPRIIGLNIYPVSLNSGANHVIYVVEIPQGTTAHQALDKRYYKSFNFESVPMEDHEIRDVMNRNKFPDIDLGLSIESRRTTIGPSILRRNTLIIRAKNVGQLYAQYVNCRIYLPGSFAPREVSLFGRNFQEVDGKPYYVLTKNNTRRDVLRVGDNSTTEGTSWFDPILPSLSHIWHRELPRDFDKSKLQVDDEIIWEVFADNAPPKSGKVRANEIEYVDRTESLLRLVQFAIQQNLVLFAFFMLFVLLMLYNTIR
jgi:Schlafen, AlbA_2